MSARSRLLVRSVAFGSITKITGALVVFLALPLAAHALTIADYAVFMKALSIASLVGLIFGIMYPLVIRDLSRAVLAGGDELAQVEAETRTLYLAAAGIVGFGGVLAIRLLPISSNGLVMEVAILLAALHGALTWGDAYRVALRSDHLSSLWQMLGNLLMVGSLLAFATHGLWVVTLSFFAIPAVVQLTIIVQLWIERRFRLAPHARLPALFRRSQEMGPIAANSASEYLRIFGSGLIVSTLTNNIEYARYTTIVYIISRLVNPISLITRPLMPACVDAIRHHDHRWLSMIRSWLLIAAGSALFISIVLGLLWNMAVLESLFPGSFSEISRLDVLSAFLLLWGFMFCALTAPFYHAAHKSTIYASINGVFILLSIVVGSLIVVKTGASVGMLISLATGSVAGAMTLLTYMSFNILSLRGTSCQQ